MEFSFWFIKKKTTKKLLMVQITDKMYIHICTLGPLVWKQVELQYPKSVPKLDSVSRIVVYQLELHLSRGNHSVYRREATMFFVVFTFKEFKIHAHWHTAIYDASTGPEKSLQTYTLCQGVNSLYLRQFMDWTNPRDLTWCLMNMFFTTQHSYR